MNQHVPSVITNSAWPVQIEFHEIKAVRAFAPIRHESCGDEMPGGWTAMQKDGVWLKYGSGFGAQFRHSATILPQQHRQLQCLQVTRHKASGISRAAKKPS